MVTRTKIDISFAALFKVVAVLLLVVIIYIIRQVLAIVFVSIILASALDPFVQWFVHHKIPRFFGTLIIYIVSLAFVSLVVLLLLPPTIAQIQNLASDFPHYWDKAASSISSLQGYGDTGAVQQLLVNIETSLSNSGGDVLGKLIDIFGGIVSFFVILVITFYLLLEENVTKKTLRFLVPARYQPYLTRILLKMKEKIGLWLRGQLVLSLIVGLIVFVGMNIFGIFNPLFAKYALVLALLAFLLEFIPYLGPTLAAVPALFIGLTQGLSWVGAILIFYAVMQWLENHIIVPQVMKRAVGLNPIIVIVALLIGSDLGGVIGMILAIPVSTALSVLAEDVFKELDQREVE